MTELHWLPEDTDWRDHLRALPSEPAAAWTAAIGLANARVSFVLENALDRTLRRMLSEPPPNLGGDPVRLAVLGSATTGHLLASIRVAGLRRGLWIDTYACDFGQYRQDLADPGSGLHAFRPTAILLSLDAHHLTAGLDSSADAQAAEGELQAVLDRIRDTWRLARTGFGCPVLQQAVLPVHPPILGNNEHRMPGSRARFVTRLNVSLREMAEAEGVDILPVDDRVARDGLAAWHDIGLWHRARQEIALPAAPFYGDLVGRWLAALRGRSFKCLVLDLDNTLWGGVIGDDGLDGIELGQGSPLGEAYRDVQAYARDLSRRGVILAVCSKNDEANALAPFERHPEMVLKRADIACFVANWRDKPDNLRTIARTLNIGLDALVFLDDNPFERNLVRQALPMVAVPELPDDPTGYIPALADAGYFDSLSITEEDRARTGLYRTNVAREALQASATDLAGYLRGLQMRLLWRPFDAVGLRRIVQLINKSNQFNLTTRRYTEDEVRAVMDDPAAVGLQLRLLDRFGDNGIIAIVIARLEGPATLRTCGDAGLRTCSDEEVRICVDGNMMTYWDVAVSGRARPPDPVMVGAGPPSTTFSRAAPQVVDGRPAPTMTGGSRSAAPTDTAVRGQTLCDPVGISHEPNTVMVGAGPPSTTFTRPVPQVVDGRPSPTMTGGRRSAAPTDMAVRGRPESDPVGNGHEANTVMVGAGPPSTTFTRPVPQVVDGGPSPTMTGGNRSAAPTDNTDLVIDTWLMSCRVLGRQVEQATLDLIVQQAARLGARRVVGDYRPSSKNAMVRDHYAHLGFTITETAPNGASRSVLNVESHRPSAPFMQIEEG